MSYELRAMSYKLRVTSLVLLNSTLEQIINTAHLVFINMSNGMSEIIIFFKKNRFKFFG
jgi:hypothetical protein